MKKASHPYKRLENDPLWRTVEKAIQALVKNGDLEEKTARTHIVGYLTQSLLRAGIAAENGSAKHRRIIQINRDEEVLVRRAVAS